MRKTIRAKFHCASVEFFGDPANPDTNRQYVLRAVYDHSIPENERFTRATPWGELKMQVSNPAAQFEVGKSYYLDFTPVEA